MQVFMRAYKTHKLNGETVDLLVPLNSFRIVIDGEFCKLYVSIGGEEGCYSKSCTYYMSEAQYNTLLLALKGMSENSMFLDGSIKS